MTATSALRFAVSAISHDVARYVRENGRDSIWGHPALTELATGFGPCRLCLHTFRAGEERRTLFTFDSSTDVAEFPQPDPSTSMPMTASGTVARASRPTCSI